MTDVVVVDSTNIQVISVAEQGPAGPSPTTYTFDQDVPSNQWVIEHNLDRYPSATVVDSAGSTIICDVQYDSPDQVTIQFSAAFSGRAYLN
jgi:hypothetical protein